MNLCGLHGVPLPWVLPLWALALATLLPACRAYNRFKQATPPGSAWRML